MRSLLGPLLARTPVPYASRAATRGASGIFALTDHANREQHLSAMGGSGTLFAIVNRTSTATAAVRWRLWRDPVRAGDDRTEVVSHAILDLLAAPNDHYTGQELVETCQQHVDLTGEGYLVVVRDPRFDLPLELWPVRPDRMEPIPSVEDFLVGWEYSSPDGERIPLGTDEVIQLRVPHPLDPYRGMGAVQTILTQLDADRYSAEWNRNFFVNSAEPGGIVEVDRRLSDDEFDELTTRWREQHRGVSNAHRVAFLEQGRWVDRKYTRRDMQFAELAQVSKTTVREAFGIPKFAVGDVDDVNRATAEASRVWFAEQLTVPRCERWKGALNQDLLPMFGATAEGLSLDYDSPVPADAVGEREDRSSKAETSRIYIETGWDPESVKTALSLPSALRWAGDARPAEPAVVDSWRRMTSHLTDHRSGHGVAAQAEIPPELATVQRDWQTALDDLSGQWSDGTTEWIDRLTALVAAALAANTLTGLLSATLDVTAQAARLAAAMAGLATLSATRITDEAADQGVRLTPLVAAPETFASRADVVAGLAAARLVSSAAAETVRRSGYGRDPGETTQAVADHLSGLSEAPTRAVLGGELTMAQNHGRLETLRSGPAARYYATEILDRNTCGPCRKIDGVELPTLDAVRLAYGGGGYLLCEGGVRCRGTFVARWDTPDG